MTEFAPLPPRVSAVDACADRIRASILRGDLEAGTRLPSERQLAESFDVNRVTVRSALAKLEAQGLVSVRQGSGYEVLDFSKVCGLEVLPSLLRTSEALKLSEVAADLLLLRRHLVIAVLERLNAAPESALESVSASLDGFESVLAEGLDSERMADADMEVLAVLLEATGSQVLRLSFNPVMHVLRHVDALREAIYAEPESNLAAYRSVFDQMRKGRFNAKLVTALLEARDSRTVERLGWDE